LAIFKYSCLFACLLAFCPSANAGLFAPGAGQSGSTAIFKDDPQFVEWATGISVSRGPMEIDDSSLGTASYGAPENAIGKVKGTNSGVVSLGDGGSATLTFSTPITNGPGFDFAVFENADPEAYLELAFVEVSSNGTDFFRFPSISSTPTSSQVGGFGTLDPTDIYDLAGKYKLNYGTPFDLEELAGVSSLLNVNAVTHVRVVDVVGCTQDAYASHDSQGHAVNDPWPTPVAAGGFDLSGVGVINEVPEPAMVANIFLLAAVGAACAAFRGRYLTAYVMKHFS
jgi:hypothetical protein